MKDLGERVKELRKGAGISQNELAERMGLDGGSVSRIETGAIWSDLLEKTQNVSNVLEVPIQSLFDESIDQSELLLVGAYRSLDKSDQVSVLRHAVALV